MYRTMVFAGLCVLAIVVLLGQVGRPWRSDTPAGRRPRDANDVQQQARGDFAGPDRQARQDRLSAGRQRKPQDCYPCAIAPADLALSDATFDGVTITNHSKGTVENVTFEVTIRDCPPGSDPATASGDAVCVTEARQRRAAVLLVPPGQSRGYRSPMSLRQVALSPQRRRYFLWRIVSARGAGTP